MAQMTINDDRLQDLAASAVVAAMGPEEREALIANALKDLMTNKERGYGFNRTSPLHDAFSRAMTARAETIAKEIIEADESITEQVTEMVREAINRVVVRDREATITKIAQAVERALFKLEER